MVFFSCILLGLAASGLLDQPLRRGVILEGERANNLTHDSFRSFAFQTRIKVDMLVLAYHLEADTMRKSPQLWPESTGEAPRDNLLTVFMNYCTL